MQVGDTCHFLADGSEVEVLELRPGAMLDARYRRGTDEFWGRSTDLIEGVTKEESDVSFLTKIQGRAAFYATARDFNQAVKAAEEYKAWCGEDLPDEAVRLRTDKQHDTRRWNLIFTLERGMTVPFKVVPMGTVLLDEEFNTVDDRFQHGLLRGRQVIVYWIPIIERLVRAGLRATLRKR